jgi:tetratricopeptide (TPR) repeat protein
MTEPAAVRALLAAALLLRLAVIAAALPHPLVAHPIVDARGYHEWASRIAGGDLLGSGVFYQEPLYPYLLGAAYAIAGARPVAAYGLNALLDVAGLALLHRATRRIFGPRAALLALVLGATYGLFLFHVVQVAKSSLDLLLTAALLLAFTRADQARGGEPARARAWLAVGLVAGLGALNRGNLLLAIPLLAARAALRPPRGRASAAAAGAFLLGVALPIAPVTARNVLVGHDLVLTSAHGGFNLYLGNNARADGTSKRVPLVRENPEYEPGDAREVASHAAGRPLRQSEVSAWWARRAVAWVAGHPGDAVGLYVRKVLLLVSATELPDSVDPRFVARDVPILAGPWPTYGVVVPLALLGFALARRAGPATGSLLVLLAAIAASLLPFYVFARYRLPLVPLLLPAAGFALAALAGAARARSRRALVGLFLVPAVILLGIPPPGLERSFAVSEANLANVLVEEGRLEDALAAYDRALAERPDYANARLARAGLLRKMGHAGEAEAELRALLAADPDEWYARYDLGRILLDRGDAEGAARAFAEAARTWPPEARLHFALGVALRRAGRPAEAAAAFREAVRRDPSSTEARWNLALLLAEAGEPDAARRELKAIVAARPDDARAADALRRLDAGAPLPADGSAR